MKKSSKYLLATVMAVSSLGLMANVSAKPFGDGGCRGEQKMGHGGKGGRGFNVDRMARKLDLSDTQKTEIESIVEGSKQQHTDLRDQMKQNRDQFKAVVDQSPLDEAAVRRLADAQGDLKADMMVLRAQKRAKINAVLTEEQRAKRDEMRSKKRRDY